MEKKENLEKQKCTLQDLECGQKTEKTWKKRNGHYKTCIMV